MKPLLSVEIFEKVPPKVCVFQKVESRKRKAKRDKELGRQKVEHCPFIFARGSVDIEGYE